LTGRKEIAVDWNELRTEYISTETSYRKLADKYNVPVSTIFKRAKKEDWVGLKKQNNDNMVAITLDTCSEMQVKRMERLQDATDELLTKIEEAITELNIVLNTKTKKTKVVEYNNHERPDKPTKEIVEEEIEVVETHSIVDRNGLKQIASALKDIKEIQMLKSDADMREQEARIKNLQKQIDDDSGNREITVHIQGSANEYSK
jgi:hypothetical protein